MIKRPFPLLLVLILTAAFLTACSVQHWIYEDLSITLPGDFQNRSAESYAEDLDFLYDNGTFAVAGTRETKQAVTASFGQADAQRYAELVVEMNELEAELTQKDGLWTFSYEAAVDDTSLTYICAIYEAQDSFWQLQAYCDSEDFEAQQKVMWEIISTAKVD